MISVQGLVQKQKVFWVVYLFKYTAILTGDQTGKFLAL